MDEETLRSRLEKIEPPAAASRFFVPPPRYSSRYLRAVRKHVVFWLVALIAGALIGVVGFTLVIAAWGGFLYRNWLAHVAAEGLKGTLMVLLFFCVLAPTAWALGDWWLGDPGVGFFVAMSAVGGWIISAHILVRDLKRASAQMRRVRP
jgi:hypothetical protein